MRVVPKEHDLINETWLSDRDRFSYLGLNSQGRADQPKIKRNGQWETVSWEKALKFAAEGMSRVIKQYGPEQWATFASPSSTLEELYLLQKLMREMGVQNLDHRLQQVDFRDQSGQPNMPLSTLKYADIEKQDAILLIGCNIDKEVPLAGIRVRKAFRNGAKIYALNAVDYEYRFGLSGKRIVSPEEFTRHLAEVALVLIGDVSEASFEIQKLLIGLEPDATAKAMAKALSQPNAAILTGILCENHPDAALIRTLVDFISKASGAKVLRLTLGANSAGAWLAGMLPHRGALGKTSDNVGLDVQSALDAKLKGYFLLAVEPGYDFANPFRTRQSMLAAEFVVMLSAYQNDSIYDYADVILPIAPYAETSGTYINVDQTWQTVKGALLPFGESRPAWKILRVLANLLQMKGFEYTSSEEVTEEIKAGLEIGAQINYTPFYPESLPVSSKNIVRLGEWPIYKCDAIVRHASALQDCATSEATCIRIHPQTASQLKLTDMATVSQGDIEITLPLKHDERVAPDVIWVANAMPETIDLGHSFAAINIKA